jgi:hypothetical protein
MKSDVMPSHARVDAEVLKNLLIEVKETVATDYQMPKPAKRSFGITDLWNIRRNARTASNLMRR